ncbi:DUF6029 family protein [Flavobacterium sp. SUN046]|uniref:DUF6029 family protein n=1 Tax=Flavobacterium sp. SUN046 TaxID=3002440 RepID=UPI002DBC5F5E|nr:DUF6029 family protein [Flavobacterium sp. SUN046]MEC4049961.1 DUF6029 family protein [Flavobacterium sp. SUN046]
MTKKLIPFFLLLAFNAFSQEKGAVTGGFEHNSQWYTNDKGLDVTHPENPLRSNSYLFLNYKYKNFLAGIQGEAYESNALLNYNPKFNGTNVATYFLQYKKNKVDLTAGYFYEQFGSGLLFRSWEDRALGINNALRGGRFIYKPTSYLTFKAVHGQQRTGFDVSKGKIYGLDTEIGLSNLMKFKTTELSLGLTYVGRDEKTDIVDPNFNRLTSAYAGRLSFAHKSFYLTSEYDYKSKDAIVQVQGQVQNNFVKPGSALLLNMGYSKKGFGLDGTFRRLENMSFFSERDAKGNAYNDRIMNFVPSLTKQQHYNLANIYVYQAQPNVILTDETLVKAGEIGGQIDVFYNFKKGTPMGGKYGTKVAMNFSNWNALGGTFYIYSPQDYKTDFFGFGKRYFSDANIEITKRWSDKWLTGFSYINQYYNKKMIQETYGVIKTNIVAAEATYKISTSKSLRVQGEHMWADSDKYNWAASIIEYNFNTKLSVYGSDMYNYGNEDGMKNHYYSLGTSYRKNTTRLSLSYGRQRGGLVCVGGVCRYVPESSGISLSLNTTF